MTDTPSGGSATDPATAALVTLLTKTDCAYCQHAKEVLARVGQDHPLEVTEISLETPAGAEVGARNGVLFAPGVLLDDKPFGHGRLSERRLRKELRRREQAAR